MNDLTKLVTFLKNWWEGIKKHTYSVSVDNFPEYPEFPEIPETIIPEYPTEIKVSNLDQIKPIDKFADIVKAIENQSKSVEPENKKVVGELKAILKELQKEKKDLTPEVITKISELIKSVDSKSIDFSVLEKRIKEIYDLLDYVKEYDEIKVKLNPKQVETLAKKMGTTIATSGGAGGGTGQYDENINNGINNLVGFEIPAYDNIVLTYVAAGYGVGKIETVIYKKNSSTVATLTLSYNINNKLSGVKRT